MTSQAAAYCSMNKLHFSRDICCVDANLDAEVVHECTNVTQSTAQPDGVCFSLFHTMSHFTISHLPGVWPLTACRFTLVF